MAQNQVIKQSHEKVKNISAWIVPKKSISNSPTKAADDDGGGGDGDGGDGNGDGDGDVDDNGNVSNSGNRNGNDSNNDNGKRQRQRQRQQRQQRQQQQQQNMVGSLLQLNLAVGLESRNSAQKLAYLMVEHQNLPCP